MSRYVYYATTALLCLMMGAGGVFDVMRPAEVMEGMTHLGFPAWFPVHLGVAKLLGVAAVVAPGLPRLKEWAYAGFTINLLSASMAHLQTGDPMSNVITPLLGVALVFGSWATRPDNRRLGVILP